MPLIVVVEDNPADATFIRMAITERYSSYKLELVRDGEAAVRRLSAEPTPDLVILDWNMPRLNGDEVLVAVRQKRPNFFAPVAVFSSSVNPDELVQAEHLGIRTWIRKPIGIQEYFDAVSQMVQLIGQSSAVEPVHARRCAGGS